MHAAKTQNPAATLPQLAWDDLRILAAVAASGSTRKAAAELALDASTVGRRLKALEGALGLQLFERLPEGMRLTATGREVAQMAEGVRESVRSLQQRVSGLDQRLAGLVRVTAAEVLGGVVSEALRSTTERYPQLTVELSVADAMVELERHAADIAVRVAEHAPESLVGRRLASSAVGLYASRDYIQRCGKDLRAPGHAFIAWPKQVEHKPAFRWLDERFPTRRTVLRATGANAVLLAARAGLGVAPLACAQALGEAGLVLLKRLPSSCSTPVWLLAHPQTRGLPRVRAVLDSLALALTARREALDGQAEP